MDWDNCSGPTAQRSWAHSANSGQSGPPQAVPRWGTGYAVPPSHRRPSLRGVPEPPPRFCRGPLGSGSWAYH